MRVVIGRGNSRQTFNVATGKHADEGQLSGNIKALGEYIGLAMPG